MAEKEITREQGLRAIRNVGIVLTATALVLMWGCPQYRVYNAEMNGRAEMAQAEQNRQIRVAEAQANADAATLQAKATIEQAKAKAVAAIEEARGVAEANKIIGASLKDNPDYLKYIYLQSLDKSSTMYVPTEGGFPVFLQQMGVKK